MPDLVAGNSPHGLTADRIESLLSARLFPEPQLADDRLYFISNLSGHLSLYVMDAAGGVPEPLLPPQLALQNPELIGIGGAYVVAWTPDHSRVVLADGYTIGDIVLYEVDGNGARTRERVLGLGPELLSRGEDASFDSHDGMRVSARLYRPSPELGYDGRRPFV